MPADQGRQGSIVAIESDLSMRTLSPVLKMEGRSGCKLEVLNREGVFFVRKHSKDVDYNDRLLRQASKQGRYVVLNSQKTSFFAPPVLDISPADVPLTWFEMPYLHGQKYSEYFERASISEIRVLGQKFAEYFHTAFKAANLEKVDVNSVVAKIESLQEALLYRSDVEATFVREVSEFLQRLPSTEIPVGLCHGDFTFSNMLFCEDGICLFDFLDSFMESPLMDLVKFRQDTFFYWSLLLEADIPPARAGKIIQIFNYLDSVVVNSLRDNRFVGVWYDYLQVFNLLRILPYVNHPREVDFVQHGIKQLMKR